MPANFVKRFPFGILFAFNDSLMLRKRNGSLDAMLHFWPCAFGDNRKRNVENAGAR